MIVLQRGIAAFEKRINKMGKFSRWLWLPMVLAAAAYLLLALTDNNYYPEDIHFAVEKMVDYNQKSDDIHSFVQSFFNFIYDLSTSIIVRVLFIGMFILSLLYAIKIKSASHIFALTSGMAIFLIILSFVGENRQEDIPRKNEKHEFKKAWRESSFQSLKNLSTNLTERESNYVLAQAYLKLKAEPGQIVKPEHADYLKAAVTDIRHNESEYRQRDAKAIYMLETAYDGKAVSSIAKDYQANGNLKTFFKHTAATIACSSFVLWLLLFGCTVKMRCRMKRINHVINPKKSRPVKAA